MIDVPLGGDVAMSIWMQMWRENLDKEDGHERNVKLVKEYGAFAAGQATHAAVGAAIGTAVFPVVGTAVGLAAGAIVGSLLRPK
jgi:uncharacterized membrane protein